MKNISHKVTLSLICLLLVYMCTSAQSTFQKIYDNPTFAWLLQTDSIGNSYAAYMNSSNDSIVITKFDAGGNMLWNSMIGNANQYYASVADMQIVNVNRIVVLCNVDENIYNLVDIFCLDSTGHTQFLKQIGNPSASRYEARNIINDSAGFTISISNRDTLGTKLLRFDNNGNIQATQFIADSNSMDGVANLTGSNYLLYGSSSLLFKKLDHNFTNTEVGYTYYSNYSTNPGYCTKMLAASDTGSVFLGVIGNPFSEQPFIGHLTKDFICDRMKLFDFGTNNLTVCNFTDAHQLSDKSWMITALRNTTYPGYTTADYIFLHTDQAFNVLKVMCTNNFIFTDIPLGESIIRFGFLADTMRYLLIHADISNSNANLQFVKTDSSFSGMCGLVECPVTITSVFLDTTAGDSVVRTSEIASATSSAIATLHYPIVSGIILVPELCDDTLFSETINNEKGILVYPNPATRQLTIHPVGWSSNGVNTSSFHNEAVTVSVMNVIGQETSPPAPLQRRGENATIDVSKLPPGMYFLQMKGESGSVVKKFVKE